MRHFHATGLALAAMAAAVGYSDQALACGATPCAQLLEAQPRSDDAVPLNTEIRVLYFGTLQVGSDEVSCALDIASLRLVSEAGDVLDLSGAVLPRERALQAWVVAKPAEPLEPRTRYEVRALLSGGDACGCAEREWSTVTTFTTADAVDVVAPLYYGVPALTSGERVRGSSTCGDSHYIPVWPATPDTLDEPAGTRYNVYVDGRIEKRFIENPRGTDGAAELAVDCGSSALSFQTVLLDHSRLEVRAVDLAGNESTPTTPIEVPVLCDPLPSDVDYDDILLERSSDAGNSEPATLPAPSRKSGCALGAAGAAGTERGWAWLACAGVALFAAIARRRIV
jgi:hypothetical protein